MKHCLKNKQSELAEQFFFSPEGDGLLEATKLTHSPENLKNSQDAGNRWCSKTPLVQQCRIFRLKSKSTNITSSWC
jgi:hypothetical protein